MDFFLGVNILVTNNFICKYYTIYTYTINNTLTSSSLRFLKLFKLSTIITEKLPIVILIVIKTKNTRDNKLSKKITLRSYNTNLLIFYYEIYAIIFFIYLLIYYYKKKTKTKTKLIKVISYFYYFLDKNSSIKI